jgi:hypothetical protein
VATITSPIIERDSRAGRRPFLPWKAARLVRALADEREGGLEFSLRRELVTTLRAIIVLSRGLFRR